MTKLIEESTVSKTVKNAIDTDKLLDWLVENSVLSIALEGKKPKQWKYFTHFPNFVGAKLRTTQLSLFQETLTRLNTARELKESSNYWGVNCHWTNSPRFGEYK